MTPLQELFEEHLAGMGWRPSHPSEIEDARRLTSGSLHSRGPPPDYAEASPFTAARGSRCLQALDAKWAVAAYKRAPSPCDEAHARKYGESALSYGAYVSSQTEGDASNRADDR